MVPQVQEPRAAYLNAERVSGGALRTLFRIAEAWQLGNKELMKLLGRARRAPRFTNGSRAKKWRLPQGRAGAHLLHLRHLPSQSAAGAAAQARGRRKPGSKSPTVRRCSAAKARWIACSSGQVADRALCGAAISRRAARRLIIVALPDVSHLEWKPSYRLIPSRFPPVSLFDRVADPANRSGGRVCSRKPHQPARCARRPASNFAGACRRTRQRPRHHADHGGASPTLIRRAAALPIAPTARITPRVRSTPPLPRHATRARAFWRAPTRRRWKSTCAPT